MDEASTLAYREPPPPPSLSHLIARAFIFLRREPACRQRLGRELPQCRCFGAGTGQRGSRASKRQRFSPTRFWFLHWALCSSVGWLAFGMAFGGKKRTGAIHCNGGKCLYRYLGTAPVCLFGLRCYVPQHRGLAANRQSASLSSSCRSERHPPMCSSPRAHILLPSMT
jgi:hypothetical protein